MIKLFNIKNYFYLVIILIVLFFGLLFGFEFLLSKINPLSNPHVTTNKLDITKRFINFREHPLNSDTSFEASKLQIINAPSLEGRKFQYKTDDNGFLLPGNRYKDAEKRIFFLGGSTTENLLVDEKNRFSYLFQSNLENIIEKN